MTKNVCHLLLYILQNNYLQYFSNICYKTTLLDLSLCGAAVTHAWQFVWSPCHYNCPA